MKNLSADGKLPNSLSLSFCTSCAEAKQTRKPFNRIGGISSKSILDLVYSDVCGPMNQESIGGARYFITFIDDYSRICAVYTMKEKSEAFERFKEFETEVTNMTGKKIRRFRTDNGGEYTSKQFESYLKSKGIKHELTCPFSPQQNGIAERINRTLQEIALAQLQNANMSKRFWAESLMCANYVRNRMPTESHNTTPYERWFGKKPKINYMRVFGCVAYVLIPKEKRAKFEKKSERMRFIGYSKSSKGFRFWNPKRNSLIVSRDAVFNEKDFDVEQSSPVDFDVCSREGNDPVGVPITFTDNEHSEHHLRRSTRETKAPERYGKWASESQMKNLDSCDGEITHSLCNIVQINEPDTITEALHSPEANEWRQAADSEYNSLMKMQTWSLQKLPANKKAIGCRWVFRVKYGSDGLPVRFKARLVAKGFNQQYGVDFDETFSPVIRLSSIRALIAFSVQYGLLIHQMDVVTAFLNGVLEEEIYMNQPPGYEEVGKEDLVCRLKRSLYGLKQSPRCWYKMFRSFMFDLGFRQSSGDPCLYYKLQPSLILIAVYVDDLIIIADNAGSMNDIKMTLSSRFEMTDMGSLCYILGISVVRNLNDVWIHQFAFIEKLLKKFQMESSTPVSTPLDINVKLVKNDHVSKFVDQKLYQSIVGSLLYVAIASRPDIQHAVSLVSKFNSCPTEAHLTAAKRILRYLLGTKTYGLRYTCSKEKLFGYCDADFAGDEDDRHSTSGFCFMLANGLITWYSKKQSIVARSTANAEYVALSLAAQEAKWLLRFFEEIGVIFKPVVIKDDSQAAMAMTRNQSFHAKSKHIEVQYHFAREEVENKNIVLEYCPTSMMVADAFTKVLPKVRFEMLRHMMGIQDMSS